MTGRFVAIVRWAATSSINTSCFPPNPPPIRGLITRIRLTGKPRTGANIRRTWNGTWVEVRITSLSSSSQYVTTTWGSIETCCTFGTSYSASKISSASLKPCSTLPISMRIFAAKFRPGSESAKLTYSGSSCIRTAFGSIALRESRIAGSGS